MLSDLEPGREHPRDWEFLQELQKTCHAMQTRLVDLVDKVANEEITSKWFDSSAPHFYLARIGRYFLV